MPDVSTELDRKTYTGSYEEKGHLLTVWTELYGTRSTELGTTLAPAPLLARLILEGLVSDYLRQDGKQFGARLPES